MHLAVLSLALGGEAAQTDGGGSVRVAIGLNLPKGDSTLSEQFPAIHLIVVNKKLTKSVVSSIMTGWSGSAVPKLV